MKATAPRMRRRWLWLLGLAVLALGGWFALRVLLQPERLSAFLLQQAHAATGLSFELDRPADIGFWPDLHLVLEGLTVRAPDSDVPILRGHRVELVLPWSALRGETLHLRELRMVPMALDLDALLRWLDARSDLGPPAPLRLPQLDAGVFISRSRITYGDWTLADFNLHLPGLRHGQMSTLALSAILGGPEVRIPFSLTSVFVPQQVGNEIRLDPIALGARPAPQAEPWFEAAGKLVLDHPQRLELESDVRLPHWPDAWPALPLPASPDEPRVTLHLDYDGAPDLRGELGLRLAREGASLVGTTTLGAMRTWLDTPTAPGLPPLRAELQAPLLEFGETRLQGVRLRVRESDSATEDADGDS